MNLSAQGPLTNRTNTLRARVKTGKQINAGPGCVFISVETGGQNQLYYSK